MGSIKRNENEEWTHCCRQHARPCSFRIAKDDRVQLQLQGLQRLLLAGTHNRKTKYRKIIAGVVNYDRFIIIMTQNISHTQSHNELTELNDDWKGWCCAAWVWWTLRQVLLFLCFLLFDFKLKWNRSINVRRIDLS